MKLQENYKLKAHLSFARSEKRIKNDKKRFYLKDVEYSSNRVLIDMIRSALMTTNVCCRLIENPSSRQHFYITDKLTKDERDEQIELLKAIEAAQNKLATHQPSR